MDTHFILDGSNGAINGSYSSTATTSSAAKMPDGSSFTVSYINAMTSSESGYSYAQLKKNSGLINSVTPLDEFKSIEITFKSASSVTLSLDSSASFSNPLASFTIESGVPYDVPSGATHFQIKAGSNALYIASIHIVMGSGSGPYVPPTSSSTASSSSSRPSSSQSSSSSSRPSSSQSSYPTDPTGYYAGISGTAEKATLKTQLFNLIKGHTDKGYAYAYTAYQTTDTGPDGKIIDMYSACKFDPVTDHQGAAGKSDYKKEGDLYNREHTIPQSIFNEASPMKSDLHHLLPTDGYVNNRRSNYPHAEVSSADYTSSNGCKMGSSKTSGVTGKVFEVIDEYKGDIARIYFYFVTRYENKLSSFGNFATFTKNTYPSLSPWAISLYLKWAEEDPVSQREIDRNDAIYAIQGNRNPFVDHPEYATRIWG